MLLAMADADEDEPIIAAARMKGYRVCAGRVGSMSLEKIVAAVETAARREILDGRDVGLAHGLYHACYDCLLGALRGQLVLGTVLRTAALKFAVVLGEGRGEGISGRWIAVAMYGLIGAPIRGNEHELVGLGISHL